MFDHFHKPFINRHIVRKGQIVTVILNQKKSKVRVLEPNGRRTEAIAVLINNKKYICRHSSGDEWISDN